MGLLDFLTAIKRPVAGTPVCSPEALRERLLGLNRPTAPWRVVDGAAAGVDLIAEWKIVDAEWYEIFAKAGLERVFSISLRLDPARQEVRAQDREWHVAWEAGVPTLALSARVSRGQTWSFSAGAAYGFTETLAPGEIYRYRFATEEIKRPLQDSVTGCGWTYKGVLFGKP
jgi:outer membrane protein TolC